MAQTTEFQRASFPLPTYNYRVEVGGVTMSFSSVSGLVVERSTATYKHGLSFREGDDIVQFAFETFVPVTLERGVVIGFEELADWLVEGDTRTMDVSLCDEEGSPVVAWHVAKAVPVRLSAPTLTANANDVAVESLEIQVSTVSMSHPGAT